MSRKVYLLVSGSGNGVVEIAPDAESRGDPPFKMGAIGEPWSARVVMTLPDGKTLHIRSTDLGCSVRLAKPWS